VACSRRVAVARGPVMGIPATVGSGWWVAVAAGLTVTSTVASVVSDISGAVGLAVSEGLGVSDAGGEGLGVTKGRPLVGSGDEEKRKMRNGPAMTAPSTTRLATANR
jgi:hypothetical protein